MLQDVAKALGLHRNELKALIKVRDELRAEQMTFFDMKDGGFCIAGHMGRRLGHSMRGTGQYSYTAKIGELPHTVPFRRLCYPPSERGHNPGYEAGQVEAAKAIDRFLVGAEPWPVTY